MWVLSQWVSCVWLFAKFGDWVSDVYRITLNVIDRLDLGLRI